MINAMPKLVAFTTLRGPLNSLIDGDLVETITTLKQSPGKDIVMCGSTTLTRHDLIDTYKITVFPVILGHGTRLFPYGTAPNTFHLAATKPLRSGAVILTHHPKQQHV